MSAEVNHLHTYFLFPFSVDQAAVMEEHPAIWKDRQQWFEKLDAWVTKQVAADYSPAAVELRGWQRAPHKRFDIRSPAYQDMLFFHPFVRRVFFDTGNLDTEHEALVHRYVIPIGPDSHLFYEAEDVSGKFVRVCVTDLRLLMFANGIGILTIGVEAHAISYAEALWINEMMRKIYPSSDRQIQTGRIPSRLSLVKEAGGERKILAEERWETSRIIGLRPQLSAILQSLLHFANYQHEEYEPVLDERMIVNSFVSLERDQVPAGFEMREEYEIAFSRLLYVDWDGDGYRYEPQFTREQMKKHVYRRWQHQGTLYGATSYSNVTSVLSCPETSTANSLVYRMFKTKNHLIAVIALFYRASLLDFAKESALVSRQLFPVFSGQVVRHHHIQFATRLMADFHYFNNYWFFRELTNKDEELEHFRLICDAYQVDALKEAIGNQIDKLAGYIDRQYALRNSDAVNRLAMISVILGVGALVTGYYGMNVPHLEGLLQHSIFSFVSLALTSLMALASLSFILYIVVFNWVDYRSSLLPHHSRKSLTTKSLRQLRHFEHEDDEDAAE